MADLTREERLQKKGALIRDFGVTMQAIGRSMFGRVSEEKIDEFFAELKETADAGVALKKPVEPPKG